MINDTLEVGTQLDNYTIQSILGRGAFGITYLAHEKNLNYFVAIKEYMPRELAIRDKDMTVSSLSIKKNTQFDYGLESFLREAQTIAKFKHPNIVRILTFFRKNKTAYIVMEYEKGKTLKTYVEERNDLSEKRLLEIFCPINEGLCLMHQQGYIHRDIKPENIVIREDNTPVLIDFGTARDTLNSNNSDLTQIFTRGYAPFEQCHPTWAEQGAWSDIYSLGATLYFTITGKKIVASELRMVNDPYQPLIYLDNDAYSEHFLKAIDDALLFHPKERPQSLEDWMLTLCSYDNKKNMKEDTNGVQNTKNYINKSDKTVLYKGQPVDGTSYKGENPKNRPITDTHFEKLDKMALYGNRTIDDNLNIVESNNSSKNKKILFAIAAFIVVLVILVFLYLFKDKVIPASETPSIEKDSIETPSIEKDSIETPSIEKDSIETPSIEKDSIETLPTIETFLDESFYLLPKTIQGKLKRLVSKTRNQLLNNELTFSDTVALCNDINTYTNKFPYKEIREIYLTVLQKSLAAIPPLKLKDEHIEWLKIHQKNINENISGKYVIKPQFKQMLLEETTLYGMLMVESPNLILDVEILGNKSQCTHEKLCKTPLEIKVIRSGKEHIVLSHKDKGININNIVNIHPHQEYILYIE